MRVESQDGQASPVQDLNLNPNHKRLKTAAVTGDGLGGDRTTRAPTLCKHQRRKSRCKDCGGSEICEHQRIKSRCKDCRGSSFCEHQRRKSQCKDCRGGGSRQVLQKTGQTWQRAAKVDYAVRSAFTDLRRTTLTDESAMKTLQEYNDNDSSGKKSCPMQEDTDADCGTSIRGAYEVRQRTINVAGHDIVAPANGTWYQTSEAVRILLDLKQHQIRLARQLVDVWRSKAPPWIGMGYKKLMKHVQRVENDMFTNNCTVDESIKRLITNRTAVDHMPLVGRPKYLSPSAFVAGMSDSGRQEEASSKKLVVKILNDAKMESYPRRRLRPPKPQVHQNTVEKYWQHLGGKEAVEVQT